MQEADTRCAGKKDLARGEHHCTSKAASTKPLHMPRDALLTFHASGSARS